MLDLPSWKIREQLVNDEGPAQILAELTLLCTLDKKTDARLAQAYTFYVECGVPCERATTAQHLEEVRAALARFGESATCRRIDDLLNDLERRGHKARGSPIAA